MALSAVGAANMSLGALRQFGVISHLPDPPIRGFDSNAVITSGPAFALGVPDTPVAALGLVANVPLQLALRDDDAARRPWLPVAIAAKAVVEVAVSAWYLVQMRTRVHAWCAYCLAGASVNVAIAALTIPEAAAVLRTPRARGAAVLGAIVLAAAAVTGMTLLDARHRRRQAVMRARQGE